MRTVVVGLLLALWIAASASAEGLLSVDPERWTFQKVDNPAGVANADVAAFALTIEQCPKVLIETRDGDGLFIKDIGKELDLQCRTVLAAPKHGDARHGLSPEPWRQAFSGKSVPQIATGSGVIVAAVGEETVLLPQTLYRSLDGGEQWEVAYRLPEDDYVRNALFVRAYDESRPMIASIRDGGESYYIRSIDKGPSWQRHEYGDVFEDEDQIIWDLVELSCYEKHCPACDVDSRKRRVYHQCEGGATAWPDDSGATWSYDFVRLCTSRSIRRPAAWYWQG